MQQYFTWVLIKETSQHIRVFCMAENVDQATALFKAQYGRQVLHGAAPV